MNRSRLLIPGLAAACVMLAIGALVASGAANALLRRSVISGAGGTAVSGQVSMGGTLGQTIVGQSVGATTKLHAGWRASIGDVVRDSVVYVPMIGADLCGGFSGTRECEDNDGPNQANGPMQFGQPVVGTLTDHDESGPSEHTEDWYFFNWSGAGTVSIDVTNFAPVGQVILYYESASNFVTAVSNQGNGTYHLTHDGSAGSGMYLVRLFVPAEERLSNAPAYTLVVSN